MKNQSKRFTIFALLLATALALTACVAAAPSSDDMAADAGGMEKEGGYVIGVSNTLVGNGWREQMICAIKGRGHRQRACRQSHRRQPQRRPDRADRRSGGPHLPRRGRHHPQPDGP